MGVKGVLGRVVYSGVRQDDSGEYRIIAKNPEKRIGMFLR